MDSNKVKPLFLTSAVMELSWLYAWVTLISMSTIHQVFPFAESVAVFILTAVVFNMAMSRGWRRISVVVLYVLIISVAAIRMLYVFNWISTPITGLSWAQYFFRMPMNMHEILVLIIIFIGVLLFWSQGLFFARRSASYYTFCDRFEIGAASFFCLLLVNILITKLHNPTADILLFSFFGFSLLTIGLARDQNKGKTGYLAGFRGIGVVISFGVIIISLGTGVVLFTMQYLTQVAELGYGILKKIMEPLLPFFAAFIRFIFDRPIEQDQLSEADSKISGMGIKFKIGEQALGDILISVFSIQGVIGLIFIGVVIWYICRWLLSKTSESPRDQRPHGGLVLWLLTILWKIFSFFRKRLLQMVQGRKKAVGIYKILLDWGSNSGIPCSLNETPAEYNLRLGKKFPSVKKEIKLIIDILHEEVFAETVLTTKQLSQARAALRKISSPLLWPSRLRLWFQQ